MQDFIKSYQIDLCFVVFVVVFKDAHGPIFPPLGTHHLPRNMISFWFSDPLCNL